VDVARMHFFDPDSGRSIFNGSGRPAVAVTEAVSANRSGSVEAV
jgi:hypothetical protein